MDDELPSVVIVVSRVDTTSPMQLCLDVQADLTSAGHKVRILEIKRLASLRGIPKLLAALDATGEADILLSCGALADISTAVLRASGRRRKRKFVAYLHCHQWQDLRFERNAVWALVYFAVWRWSVFLKDCIACVSFDVLNNLPPRLAARTRVVYNHVDEAAVGHPASSAGQDDSASAIRWISEQQRGGKKVVLAFGLFRRRKNLVSLIQAVEQMPDTALLLVGEGHDEPRLRMAASALQRQGRFLIHPFMPRPVRLCAHADAYASCSHSEGFGLANLEAAMSGIATVVPCHSVNLEILADCPNVTFYNPSAPTHLAEQLSLALSHPARDRIMPSARFTRTRFANEWLRLLATLNLRSAQS